MASLRRSARRRTWRRLERPHRSIVESLLGIRRGTRFVRRLSSGVNHGSAGKAEKWGGASRAYGRFVRDTVRIW